MTALALALVLTPPGPSVQDDTSGSYCLATGFCRGQSDRGPASGVLFLAVGLVSAGVIGLRARPKP